MFWGYIILMSQFQKSSKTFENHRCDLKAERFRLVTYQAAASIFSTLIFPFLFELLLKLLQMYFFER